VEFILLRDALKEMETAVDGYPRRFSVTAISWDEQRGTGGEILEFKDTCLNDAKITAFKSSIPEEHRRVADVRVSQNRNPHHRENKTKNLRLANGQIRKIHLRFITHYNGVNVIY
jgi:hypothetical protein